MNICSEALEHMFIFQVCFFTIFWSEKSVVDYAVSVLSAVEGSQSFTDGLYAILRFPYSALPHRKPLLIFLLKVWSTALGVTERHEPKV